jgi:hypothetical protein
MCKLQRQIVYICDHWTKEKSVLCIKSYLNKSNQGKLLSYLGQPKAGTTFSYFIEVFFVMLAPIQK